MPKRRKILKEKDPICTQCVNSIIIKDTKEGMNVCSNCGLVLGNRIISDECEWRSFADSNNNGADMNRIGGPSHPLLAEEEIGSTQIASSSNSALTRNQIRGSSGKSQQLFEYYRHIEDVVQKLKLSATVKFIAQSIFKQLFDLGEVRGRNKDTTTVACAYIACKIDGVPRTIRELCAASGVKRRDVGRSYIAIQKLQQSGRLFIRKSRFGDSNRNSHRFVTRFCSELSLPPAITNEATDFCKRLDALPLTTGKAPASIAAVSILATAALSADLNYTKSVKEIAQTTHVSSHSIKKLAKLIRPEVRGLISPNYAGEEALASLDFGAL